MKDDIIAALLIASSFSAGAEAKKKPETWTAKRVVDPITGANSCRVTAFDRAAGLRFTRTGSTYPSVELNSRLGLLVGVSSGGRYRLPTGDILWRVDNNPHREIRAADNPAAADISTLPADAAATALQSTTAGMHRLIAAATATSTMASGDKAKEMLAEMRGGSGLIFRVANVQAFGLAADHVQEVGQITREGLKPIPLDESFRAGLASCGIN